jgi:hypothetical protein
MGVQVMDRERKKKMESRNQMIWMHLHQAERGIGRRSRLRIGMKLAAMVVGAMLAAVYLWAMLAFVFAATS